MTATCQATTRRGGAAAPRTPRAPRAGAGAGPVRRRGFTIVEVMAALVVVAIVLPTLIHGTLLCLDLAVHARMQAQAASLAQAKLSELAATQTINDAMQTGDFGEQWPQYRWIATVQSWYDPRLLELDVSVVWVRKGMDYDVTVSTLVYDGASGG